MRASRTKTVTEQKPIGVIQALATGFDIVRQRPWTLLVPILFDAVLWVAPRLSLTPLVQPVLQELNAYGPVSPESAEALNESRAFLQSFAESINLLGLVSAALNKLVQFPSLLALDPKLPASPVTPLAYSLTINSGWLTLLLFAPLFVLALFANAIFLDGLAEGVRPLEQKSAGQRLHRVVLLWARLILFAGMMVAIFLLLSPLLLVAAQAGLLNAEIGALFSALVLVFLFWLFIYLYFVAEALAVVGVGLLDAVRHSLLTIRFNFWKAILLIMITLLLNQGLGLLLRGLEVSTVGVLFAIIANAFLGASLIAAAMVFYLDRLNWFLRWREKMIRNK